MIANRISGYSFDAAQAVAPLLPSGFAVCQLAPAASPLTIQLVAQQQAYEQALIAAREDALRIALSRLQMSPN